MQMYAKESKCDGAAVDSVFKAWSDSTTGVGVGPLEALAAAGSPQVGQVAAEVPHDEAVTFTLGERTLLHSSSDVEVVAVDVAASAAGFVTETMELEVEFVIRDGRCLLWTIVGAGDSEVGVDQDRPSLQVSEAVSVEGVAGTQAGNVVMLPPIVAWIVVVTLVAVALAGYLAPRLDRRRT
jgi:hypothetical protein